MPEVGGEQLAVVAKTRFPGMKVAYLSVHSERKLQQLAETTGADGFIRKSSDFDRIVAQVEALLTAPPRPDRYQAAMAQLRAKYSNKVVEQLDALQDQLAEAAAKGADPAVAGAAKQLAHRIHGTAATYGFEDVAEVTRSIEDELGELIASQQPFTEPMLERATRALRRVQQSLAEQAG